MIIIVQIYEMLNSKESISAAVWPDSANFCHLFGKFWNVFHSIWYFLATWYWVNSHYWKWPKKYWTNILDFWSHWSDVTALNRIAKKDETKHDSHLHFVTNLKIMHQRDTDEMEKLFLKSCRKYLKNLLTR